MKSIVSIPKLYNPKPKFTWENYVHKTVAVRCTTEEQAELFLKLCQINGIPCVPETFWEVYQENTCYESNYDANEGWFSNYTYYFNECYIIYDFSDVVLASLDSIGKTLLSCKTVQVVRPYRVR